MLSGCYFRINKTFALNNLNFISTLTAISEITKFDFDLSHLIIKNKTT